MLLQIKVYLIGLAFLLGGSFMISFPPREFEQSGGRVRTSKDPHVTTKHYFSYAQIVEIAEDLALSEPELVNTVYLTPRTAENRSIIALELKCDLNTRKPGILVVGALDAMVWGAPNAIIDLANKLVFDSNYQVPYLNDYDWYLIPMANPDGIEFTQHISNRPSLNITKWTSNSTAAKKHKPSEWHKNTEKEFRNDSCFGTNINRNFAYHWQDINHKLHPYFLYADDLLKSPERCSQYYTGQKPFSAAESQALRDYIEGLADIVYLAVHLHGSFVLKKELLLYPWRYSQRQLSNYETLQSIGENAARQSRLDDGRLYEVHQSSADNDGRVAGSIDDYMTGVVGIELVYIFKPYHPMYPALNDTKNLSSYVNKSRDTILSVVRAWRSSHKQYTLSFFGRTIEY